MSDSAASLILRGDPRDDAAWKKRLDLDARTASQNQTSEMKRVTAALVDRTMKTCAEALALTGSTARGKRTRLSDLDYHIVGVRPSLEDLPADVDAYAGDRAHLWRKLLAGDDFAQWTLRCGCILYDCGVLREAAVEVVERDLWPDGAAKLKRLPELRRLADRLLTVGDRDAAQDQVRATLTGAARGVLLLHDVFPLARSELPGQLRGIGLDELAHVLAASIYQDLSLARLAEALAMVDGPLLPTVA